MEESVAADAVPGSSLLGTLVAASPLLRAAEDALPYGALIVLIFAALSLAVIVQHLASPPSVKAKEATQRPRESARRRDAESDLAIEPDGSKDKPDRIWKRELAPEVYASLRSACMQPYRPLALTCKCNPSVSHDARARRGRGGSAQSTYRRGRL